MMRMKDGRLVRQVKGIPMGDALSPAMTIGTCAWMEREWMATLDDATKARFRARRYMDDLLLLYKADDTWDHERFCNDIQTGCYMPPLKLEDSKDGTFLENTFKIEGGSLRFRLKNVNEGGKRNVWRYHDYDSYVAYGQKPHALVCRARPSRESFQGMSWRPMGANGEPRGGVASAALARKGVRHLM